jgi:hypothetical protein
MMAGMAVAGSPSQSRPSTEGERGEDVVDQAVLTVEEGPQQGHHDHRGDDRQEVDGAEEVDAPYLRVHQQRQHQGEPGLEWDDDGGEVHRVAQGLEEDRVLEEPGEVPQAHEARRGG